MLRIVAWRIPQMVIVVIIVTFFAFVMVNLLPGNIVDIILGNNYSPQAAAILTKELGLNHPVIWRYVLWLWGAVRFQFGSSLITHVPVSESLRQDALPTVELVIGAQLVSTILGSLFALAAVATRIGWIDRLGTGIALFFTSMPNFVFAVLLLALFGVHWHFIPTIGWADPTSRGWVANLHAIAVPVLLLGFGAFPGHMRIFRSEMYQQMENEDYQTLATMKGISTWRIMTRHVARNSAFGLVTVIATGTAILIGGAVILENLFAIPGIGGLLLEGVSQRDSPIVEACITLIAVAVVLFNLIADLGYALLDPRVRDGQR